MPSDRVTEAEIDDLLSRSTIEEHVFHKKELIVSYLLPNGFTVTGKGACINPENFDINIGRKVAQNDVKDQLWQLQGYLRQIEFTNGVVKCSTKLL
jgi:Phage protein (N4 Gp49/phage Sf6 gene 66) family